MEHQQNDAYVSALRNALVYVTGLRLDLEDQERLAGYDGVTIAANLADHAVSICDAHRDVYGTTPCDYLTGEAGFLAGYWQTTALLHSLGGTWLDREKAWLDHAIAMLTDEISGNTPA